MCLISMRITLQVYDRDTSDNVKDLLRERARTKI